MRWGTRFDPRRAGATLAMVAALLPLAVAAAPASAGQPCAERAGARDCRLVRLDAGAVRSLDVLVQRAERGAVVAETRAAGPPGTTRRAAWRAATAARRDAARVTRAALSALREIRRRGSDEIADPEARRFQRALTLRAEALLRARRARGARRLAENRRRSRRPGRRRALPVLDRRERAADLALAAAMSAVSRFAPPASATWAAAPPFDAWMVYSARVRALARPAVALAAVVPARLPRAQRAQRARLLVVAARAARAGAARALRRAAGGDRCRRATTDHLRAEIARTRVWGALAAAQRAGRVARQRRLVRAARGRASRIRALATTARACGAGPSGRPTAPFGADGPPRGVREPGDPGLPLSAPPPDALDAGLRRGGERVADRLAATSAATPVDAFPFYTEAGRWVTAGGATWISGFFPGALWLEFQRSGDRDAAADAAARQEAIAAAVAAQLTADPAWSNHDLGFMFLSSFVNGHRLLGDDAHRRRAIERAGILADRFVPSAGVIRAFSGGLGDPEVVAITDTLMNAELLLWAAANGGDPEWRDRAIQHALTTRAEHIRQEGSVYHVVVFDAATGTVLRKSSRGQGFATESVWARGQAWAMHGFTTMYRETGDDRFLDAARRVSDWYLDNLPADAVPFWDFRDPAVPLAPRDTSSAAVAASALLDLSGLDPDAGRRARYLDEARRTLTSLAGPDYLSDGEESAAALLHGTYNFHAGRGIDEGAIWGEMYFLQAILRHRLAPVSDPVLPAVALAAGDEDHPPGHAVDGDPATRWSAAGPGAVLRLDLSRPRVVTKVSIAFHRGDRRATGFAIEASSDGLAWSTQETPVSSGDTTGFETFDIPDTAARHVRIVGRGTTEDDGIAISEIRLHGGEGPSGRRAVGLRPSRPPG